MNRTEEGLFVGVVLVVLTLAVLYGVRTLTARTAPAEAPDPVVAAAPARSTAPATTGTLGETASSQPHASQPSASPPSAPSSPVVPALPPATPAPAPVQTAPAEVLPAPASPRPPAASAPVQADPLVRGRQLARLLYGERLDDLWTAFTPAVRADWGTLAAFRAYRRSGLEAYGAETRVLSERVTRDGPLTYYTRTSTFERGPREGWALILGLDTRGRVQEFGIVEAGLVPEGAGGSAP